MTVQVGVRLELPLALEAIRHFYLDGDLVLVGAGFEMVVESLRAVTRHFANLAEPLGSWAVLLVLLDLPLGNLVCEDSGLLV